MVLNADDARLVQASQRFNGQITWFSLNAGDGWLAEWIKAGGEAAVLENNSFVFYRGGQAIPILPVEDFPVGLKGAAKYNIANALGAIALAFALGLPVEAMAEGLRGFTGSPEENPGRGNFIELGGVTVLVDFAHNPHGVGALIDSLQNIPAKRRLYLLGQAGDRSDDDIRELTRVVWRDKPARVIVKELPKSLRGRQPGEVPQVIADELSKLGATADIVGRTDREMDAVHQALDWAEEGDLLVLLLHNERKASLELLQRLRDEGWRPGQTVGP